MRDRLIPELQQMAEKIGNAAEKACESMDRLTPVVDETGKNTNLLVLEVKRLAETINSFFDRFPKTQNPLTVGGSEYQTWYSDKVPAVRSVVSEILTEFTSEPGNVHVRRRPVARLVVRAAIRTFDPNQSREANVVSAEAYCENTYGFSIAGILLGALASVLLKYAIEWLIEWWKNRNTTTGWEETCLHVWCHEIDDEIEVD
jgi:hypothetical protein